MTYWVNVVSRESVDTSCAWLANKIAFEKLGRALPSPGETLVGVCLQSLLRGATGLGRRLLTTLAVGGGWRVGLCARMSGGCSQVCRVRLVSVMLSGWIQGGEPCEDTAAAKNMV